jgi:GntR family transcriptional repressor for pyruvate dehydrogenase complex
MFRPIRPRRISHEVIEQVREAITCGGLKPGDRLPSEREMAKQLGVSRPTLREALQALEHAGFIRSVQGDGTYVRDPGERSLRDPLCQWLHSDPQRIVQLAEFRTAIETWAAGLAAQRMTSEESAQLGAILRRMEEGVKRGASVHALDAQFHLTLAHATQNGVYFHVANTVFYLFAEVTRLSHEEIFTSQQDQKRLLEEHRAIFDAVRRGDVEGARTAMQRHLHYTETWFRRRVRDGRPAQEEET